VINTGIGETTNQILQYSRSIPLAYIEYELENVDSGKRLLYEGFAGSAKGCEWMRRQVPVLEQDLGFCIHCPNALTDLCAGYPE
jgi:hypothetical protein